MTYIGEYMLRECKALRNIELPESIRIIKDSAFSYCTGLTSIILPKNVSSIEEDAFEGCTSIKVVVSLNPTPPSLDQYSFDDTDVYKTAELQVPSYSIDLYRKTDNNWWRFYKIVPLEIEEVLPQEIIIQGAPEGALQPSESIQLSAQIIPEDTFSQAVKWSSSNSYVATVTQDGFVLALSEGTTTISVFLEEYPEICASCVITVGTPGIDAQEILLNITSENLKIGEKLQLIATVLPEDTSDKTLIWESSDPNIADVDENGLVTAISAGECIITATCDRVSASCLISVDESTGVEVLYKNPYSMISVYSIDGVMIKKDCKMVELNSLPKGIYIIVFGKERYKISI